MDMLTAVILAAGKGTRMGSDLPKVLHPLSGRPLVSYPLEAARRAGAVRVVVVTGYREAEVRAAVRARAPEGVELRFVHQAEQRGTGHAVRCARGDLPSEGSVLVLSGDVPLVRAETLVALRRACEEAESGLALASFEPPDPAGYGRILRDAEGRVRGIREQADASPEERELRECNAGTYCIRASALHAWLPRLGADNAQGEMYLTDLAAMAAEAGGAIAVRIAPIEAAGVNTPEQLRRLEEAIRSS